MLADTDLIDLGRYLPRIGLGDDATPLDVRPSISTLNTLIAAHVRNIPFEGLDPFMGRPVHDLAPRSLQRKVVERRRGGFCYEQNGVFAAVLRTLGFDVVALGGRVVWMREPGFFPPETHQLLDVGVPGSPTRYLVDVGFGGLTPSCALSFAIDEPQSTDLETFRVSRVDPASASVVADSRSAAISDPGATDSTDQWFALTVMLQGVWRPLYLFTRAPRRPVDLVTGSWFASTHPSSRFVSSVVAAIVTDDGRVNLTGDTVSEHRKDGSSEKSALTSVDDAIAVLEEVFGIDTAEFTYLPDRLSAIIDGNRTPSPK